MKNVTKNKIRYNVTPGLVYYTLTLVNEMMYLFKGYEVELTQNYFNVKTNSSRMQRRGLAWVYPKLGFNLGYLPVWLQRRSLRLVKFKPWFKAKPSV